MHNATISIKARLVSPADSERLIAVRQIPHSDWADAIDMESADPFVTIWGRDHDHLVVLAWTLQNEHGIAMTFQEPEIAYRESITRGTVIDYTHRQSEDGAEQTVRLVLEISPADSNVAIHFSAQPFDAPIPQSGIASAERGCLDALHKGLCGAKHPLINIGVTLRALSYDAAIVPESAVVNAARAAFGKGVAEGGLMLLEPIMQLALNLPEEFSGDVVGDICKRRGTIQSMIHQANGCSIKATVPVSTLFGYSSSLKKMTHGRASYTSQFSHYDPVPQHTPPDDGRFPSAAALRA